MKKTLVIAGALLALSAPLASAQGINLSWDDCGTTGTAFQTFDCASNSGIPFTMYASFIPPAGVNSFLGILSQMDITSSTPALPEWWKHGTTQCRGTSGMSVGFDFTSGPFTCVDFYVGQAAGGSNYDVAFGAPNRARLLVTCAVPFDNRGPVDPVSEYYAYKVNIQRSKSAFGTGQCVGCDVPMCIVLNNIQLFQDPAAGNDPDISNPASRNYVTWQASSVSGCPLSTPTHNSSWGQLKSLYR